MKNNLDSIIRIIEFTNRLKEVYRAIKVPSLERMESTAEHSFQLPFVVWYLAPYLEEEIDVDRAIKLALCHDLVEAYAGDIYLFSSSSEIDKKKAEEAEALIRISKEFSDFPEMLEAIKEFENKETIESQFVNFCDRVAPFVNDLQTNFKASIDRKTDIRIIASKNRAACFTPKTSELIEHLLTQLSTAYKDAGLPYHLS